MLETVIGLAVAIVLWKLRKAFYSTLEDFETSMHLSKTEKELETQEEIRDMIKLVEDSKNANGGKWYSVKDLDLSKKAK
jgi:tRNA C32,U32 (ribose-2'-O)-methylase TrmJ